MTTARLAICRLPHRCTKSADGFSDAVPGASNGAIQRPSPRRQRRTRSGHPGRRWEAPRESHHVADMVPPSLDHGRTTSRRAPGDHSTTECRDHHCGHGRSRDPGSVGAWLRGFPSAPVTRFRPVRDPGSCNSATSPSAYASSRALDPRWRVLVRSRLLELRKHLHRARAARRDNRPLRDRAMWTKAPGLLRVGLHGRIPARHAEAFFVPVSARAQRPSSGRAARGGRGRRRRAPLRSAREALGRTRRTRAPARFARRPSSRSAACRQA
jgi:hypothetical protein